MKHLTHKLAAAVLAAVLAIGLALPSAKAGGMYEQYPLGGATTGAETFAADTNLSGGRNPQTAKYTFQQLGLGAIQYNAPLTGASITVLGTTGTLLLEPAGTIATLTVTLPALANLQQGQILRISSTQTVTALTLTAGSGTTIAAQTPTAITVSATASYGYKLIFYGTKWYRLQ